MDGDLTHATNHHLVFVKVLHVLADVTQHPSLVTVLFNHDIIEGTLTANSFKWFVTSFELLDRFEFFCIYHYHHIITRSCFASRLLNHVHRLRAHHWVVRTDKLDGAVRSLLCTTAKSFLA